MNPTTDELIKEGCSCNAGQSCQRCDRLQGRLDVYEEWHSHEAEHIHQLKCCYLGKQISKIKAVLS